ncbi:MAG: gliding motility-associated C-terminal domain-containing protein, partial [Saprospiraceae bacterium]
ININSSGIYSLQISNICFSASDTIIVSVNANPPHIDLPSSIKLCTSDTLLLNAGLSGVQFLWNDSSHSSSLAITTPGLYSLTVSNSCGADSDTISVVAAGPPPSVSLGQDILFCSFDVPVITPVSSNVISWLWQNGSVDSTYSVIAPGIITVQATNDCGTSYDTLIAALSPGIPSLLLGADTSLCPGESLLLFVNIPNVGILWSDGSTNPDFSAYSSGSFYASISNMCGTSSDTININSLPPIPVLDLGIDQSLCPGDLITLSPGIAGVNYFWQDGSTDSTFSTIQAQFIILTISNACGFDTDTLMISENSNGPQIDLGPDILACEGNAVNLTSGIFGVNYLWQDGTTASNYTTTVSGTYILQVNNSCGSDADTVNVMIDNVPPSVNLGGDTLVCEGQIVLLSADVYPGTSVTWQDGTSSSIYSVTSSGTYILYESNHCGNASDTIDITFSGTAPQAELGGDTVLCEGQSIRLTAQADAETSIVWQDGTSSPGYLVFAPGSYHLTTFNHCGIASDTIFVSYEVPPLDFDLGPDTLLCPGESIILTTPQTDLLITWQDGSHTESVIANQPLLYSLTLSNACGTKTDSVNIDFDQRSLSFELDHNINWCAGDTIFLDAGQSFLAHYLWSTGDITPEIQVASPGLYSVSVTTDCNSVLQDIEIVPDENCSPDFYIPTIFSPNDDNVNDYFTISYSSSFEPLFVACSIFDRWGNMVFNTNQVSFAWDGRSKNSILNPGVYVYRIQFTYLLGGSTFSKLVSGDLTLIR